MSKRKKRRQGTTSATANGQHTTTSKKKKQKEETAEPVSYGILKPFVALLDRYYKPLLIIPLLMLLLGGAQLVYQDATTGDVIGKGISLTGGVSITIAEKPLYTTEEIQLQLQETFPSFDFAVRSFQNRGEIAGIVVESNIQDEQTSEALVERLLSLYEGDLQERQVSIETTGSALAESFFIDTVRAVIIAFIFMAVMVFIAFRKLVPGLLVIFAAFSNIIVTIAILNIIGFKLSTAGIAALLMLIGYSVDTDILLTARMLKRKSGKIIHRIASAMTTGLMMVLSTLVAVTIAQFATESVVISEIMLIILIGLLVDLVNTWLGNAGFLRVYMEKRKL